MTKLPHYYVDAFTALNKCKKWRQVNHLKRDEFLTEFIWNNNLFTFKSKSLCVENWIRSGILCVKDIFDADGNLNDLNYFSNIMKKKNNISCEYIMLMHLERVSRITWIDLIVHVLNILIYNIILGLSLVIALVEIQNVERVTFIILFL